MKRIPNARSIDQAIKSVRMALKQSIAGLNQEAAQQMARGRYEEAEAIISTARLAQEFQTEVETLRTRWKDLCRGGRKTVEKGSTTPLWTYYQPVLRALVELGGEARRVDLEPAVERNLEQMLQAGDRDPMSRGLERWQVMLRRTRKHLLAEGWIEDGKGPMWRITAAGRRAADSQVKAGKGPVRTR